MNGSPFAAPSRKIVPFGYFRAAEAETLSERSIRTEMFEASRHVR